VRPRAPKREAKAHLTVLLQDLGAACPAGVIGHCLDVLADFAGEALQCVDPGMPTANRENEWRDAALKQTRAARP